MATFYGGEQLLDIKKVTLTGNGVIYTAPAGVYATVYVRYLSSSISATGFLKVGGIILYDLANALIINNQPINDTHGLGPGIEVKNLMATTNASLANIVSPIVLSGEAVEIAQNIIETCEMIIREYKNQQ